MRLSTKKSIGETYGKLTCLDIFVKNGKSYGVFSCSCGNEHTALLANVKFGVTTSCGCVRRNCHTKHNMAGTSIYGAWHQMLRRCNNPKHVRYADYGGRGITVCDRWHDFSAFYADMGDMPRKGMSMERLDNNDGYNPHNVIWGTDAVQALNKRNNRYIEAFGLRLVITHWGNLFNVGSSSLNKLLKNHDIEELAYKYLGSAAIDELRMKWGAV